MQGAEKGNNSGGEIRTGTASLPSRRAAAKKWIRTDKYSI